jgi:ATP synthase protein I
VNPDDLPDDFDRRIAEARARNTERDRAAGGTTSDVERAGMGAGLRAASQFVSAIVGGGLVGWGVDHFAGTGPFGLLILLLAGFVVGLIGLKRFMTGP